MLFKSQEELIKKNLSIIPEKDSGVNTKESRLETSSSQLYPKKLLQSAEIKEKFSESKNSEYAQEDMIMKIREMSQNKKNRLNLSAFAPNEDSDFSLNTGRKRSRSTREGDVGANLIISDSKNTEDLGSIPLRKMSSNLQGKMVDSDSTPNKRKNSFVPRTHTPALNPFKTIQEPTDHGFERIHSKKVYSEDGEEKEIESVILSEKKSSKRKVVKLENKDMMTDDLFHNPPNK
jgi:hypothetical protein